MQDNQDTPGPAVAPSGRSSNFYVLVFGAVMLVGLVSLAWIGKPPRSVMIGQPMPRLDLQPLINAENPISNGDIENQVTVVHFWGTWCPPCQREFPEFAKLVEEFAENPEVQIISVSCSSGPEYELEKLKRSTASFLEKFSFPIPTFSDSTALSRQQLAMLSPNGSFGYPTTVLTDREGKIIAALEGYYPGEMEKLASKIRAAL